MDVHLHGALDVVAQPIVERQIFEGVLRVAE
jgi:hypothetical protein